MSHESVPPSRDYPELRWFQSTPRGQSGLRFSGGGVHLSKTMMFPEISLLLDAVIGGQSESETAQRATIQRLVLDENVLAKRTTNARRTTLKKLAELYGLYEMPIVSRALIALWQHHEAGRPLLTLLCALARDPLLRTTADVVIGVPVGANVTSGNVREWLLHRFPDRFTESTVSALAQRCVTTWAQAGHIGGPPRRERLRLLATPGAVAYAIQIAKLAGFSGEAALASPWVQVLDLDFDGAAHLARRAEAEGLLRIRSAGHVYDVELRGVLAESMGGNGGVALI